MLARLLLKPILSLASMIPCPVFLFLFFQVSRFLLGTLQKIKKYWPECNRKEASPIILSIVMEYMEVSLRVFNMLYYMTQTYEYTPKATVPISVELAAHVVLSSL